MLELFVGITRQRSHSPPSLRLGSCCLLWTLHPCWLASRPESPQQLSPAPQDGSPVSPPLFWLFLDVTGGRSPPCGLCSMPALLGSPSAAPALGTAASAVSVLCAGPAAPPALLSSLLYGLLPSPEAAHPPHLDILCPCIPPAARRCGMGVCLLPALPPLPSLPAVTPSGLQEPRLHRAASLPPDMQTHSNSFGCSSVS